MFWGGLQNFKKWQVKTLIRRRYAALDVILDDLERRLSGARVKWTDRTGSHVGSWEQFRHFVFSHYGPNSERVEPKDCPLLSFDMDQLDGLNNAQQLAVGLMLHGLGFPAMELEGDVWKNRRGVVRLGSEE